GLVGSTAIMPTVCPCWRACAVRASVMVLLPAPGGPVMPTQYPLPRAGAMRRIISGTSALYRSTCDMSCANARWSPASILSTRSTTVASSMAGRRAITLLRMCTQESIAEKSGPSRCMRADICDDLRDRGTRPKNSLDTLRLECGDITVRDGASPHDQYI